MSFARVNGRGSLPFVPLHPFNRQGSKCDFFKMHDSSTCIGGLRSGTTLAGFSPMVAGILLRGAEGEGEPWACRVRCGQPKFVCRSRCSLIFVGGGRLIGTRSLAKDLEEEDEHPEEEHDGKGGKAKRDLSSKNKLQQFFKEMRWKQKVKKRKKKRATVCKILVLSNRRCLCASCEGLNFVCESLVDFLTLFSLMGKMWKECVQEKKRGKVTFRGFPCARINLPV